MASRLTRAVVAALATVLATVPVAGCSPATPPAAPVPGTGPAMASVPGQTYNDTDVMFLQMLLPHHGQGLEIVRLGKAKATREELKTLASAIEVTQADEINTMASWLTSWGQPLRADDDAHAEHGGMPGTSPEELAVLASSSGGEFERRFLNMLIAHQDDAVQIARMETSRGVNPTAKALAERVAASRQAQIRQMLELLSG